MKHMHTEEQAAAPGSGGSFPDEVAHLAETNKKLAAALADADDAVHRLDRDYQDAKHYMVSNRSDIDPHEMFQSELALRQIDRSGAFAVDVKNRIAKLKDSPYFARIDFRAGGREAAGKYYIGRFAFTFRDELLIVDWRAPIAGVFYECEIGPAHYTAPQGRVDGTLTLKRQFKIQRGVMEYTLESSGNVQDEVLQRELSQTSDEKMKSIIATIQKEQNVIIRNQRARTLIIQGAAGSGKTSIALHRVAFLMYRQKERLTARNVTILSPNKVFGDYTSNVLPELGEEPVYAVGLQDIAEVQLERVMDFEPEASALEEEDAARTGRMRYKSTLDFLRQMDAYIAGLPAAAFEAREYKMGSFTISADWIQARLDAYGKYPLLVRLSMIAEDIHERCTAQNIRGEELPGPRTICKDLKAMLKVKSTIALYRDFYRGLGMPKMFRMAGKRTLEWNDVFPFLYMHAAFCGLKESRSIRHLVIDEMQDYTPVQYAVLNRLFPCEKTILGDFGQAIHPNHSHTLQDLLALYEGAEFTALKKSYRSTCEIIDFARKINPAADMEAIERHGPVPRVTKCGGKADETEEIRRIIRAFQKENSGTLCIITKTDGAARALHDALAGEPNVHRISPESERFFGGVSIAAVQMAKGLEFDEVVITDVDSGTYSTECDRSLLYVACTRAMHRLTLLYTGKPSPLL